MLGLVTNIAAVPGASDVAASSPNGSNSANNATSADPKGFSPLLSNMLTSVDPSDQVKFKPQLLNAFGEQSLPLERQFLPPGGALIAGGRNANSLLSTNELERPRSQLLEMGGDAARLTDENLQPLVTAALPNSAIRLQEMAQKANSAALASQLAGQEAHKLQQDLMAKQLATLPIEKAEIDLAGLRTAPQVESAAVASSAQLSNMLRDAMLLKQPTANSGENKIADTFSSAMGNLTALSAEAKGSGEAKSLMQASLNTPFSQQANWGDEVGSRVKWMVNSQVQSAELKMNPAHLGPIEVKISVQNDQTTIHFSAQNIAVREALDAAMPRLREMLNDSGVNLADVDVSDQSFAEQQKASEQERDGMGGEYGADDGLDDGLDTADSEMGEMVLSSRAVDYYA